MTLYKTKVINIGNEAEMFREEGMIILFGENAPESLSDYCYNIKVEPVAGEIEAGMELSIGSEKYSVTAVGSVVRKNLSELGHITIKFDSSREAELPGTLYVENRALPKINIGEEISISGGH
ncbi:PTS glucitol/sorbitol transporter subunit IIA [Vagococcus fluvialis]|uniref:PTS glucitol/sorbitol transporter subunit IIA n=1 Tax=Vagococcus fluvialis TaxID=2738 RepID=UPI001432BA3D|nr:PTS glucitol/sorbitol transporter subunit IIA [Vagococcus fluvialis]MBO0487345.1 PTS glucitol/sorbitol transporter subunit IIA [Vagococcus fluvialis]NKC58440.1 PTS glucitol/sorbitol transporter subunit IIA [Vagococcus fluvialis]NKD49328.1 PTS glucitol/sorbitol transporter subunit IIA [Vagococcus fluvialis]